LAGTGPLENDEQLLAGAGDTLPPNQRHALLYRMGQKALARAYLTHAKRLLQREMVHLASLQQGGRASGASGSDCGSGCGRWPGHGALSSAS